VSTRASAPLPAAQYVLPQRFTSTANKRNIQNIVKSPDGPRIGRRTIEHRRRTTERTIERGRPLVGGCRGYSRECAV